MRIAVSEALYILGEKNIAVATLDQALKDKNLAARVQALNILDNIGRDALPAVNNIKALVKNVPGMFDYDSRAARALLDKLEK